MSDIDKKVADKLLGDVFEDDKPKVGRYRDGYRDPLDDLDDLGMGYEFPSYGRGQQSMWPSRPRRPVDLPRANTNGRVFSSGAQGVYEVLRTSIKGRYAEVTTEDVKRIVDMLFRMIYNPLDTAGIFLSDMAMEDIKASLENAVYDDLSFKQGLQVYSVIAADDDEVMD